MQLTPEPGPLTAKWVEKSPDWYVLEMPDYVAQVVRIGPRWLVKVYHNGVELITYSRSWALAAMAAAELTIRDHYDDGGV